MKVFSFTPYLTAIFFCLFPPALVFANNSFVDESSDFSLLFAPQAHSILMISGLDYSSGYYGLKQKTEMLYIPMVFKYHQGNWDFGLTVSYIKMTGPGGIFGGGDGGVIPTGNDGELASNKAKKSNQNNPGQANNKPDKKGLISNEGVGDSLIKVAYAADILLQLPFLLELGGQVKIPTADQDKELGTGEFDWSIYLDLAYSFDSFSPFMTLGYKFMGDPEPVNLDNVFYSSLGLDYAFSPNLHSGIIYDYKQKLLVNSYAIRESTLYVNWSITQHWSISSYIVKGFASGSPDWASGLQFSFSL
ncbi:MAG: hypothetical protein QM479_13950 [Pseudomonadota bacterium]